MEVVGASLCEDLGDTDSLIITEILLCSSCCLGNTDIRVCGKETLALYMP